MALSSRKPYAPPVVTTGVPGEWVTPLLMCTDPLVQCASDPLGVCTGDPSGICGCPSSDPEVCGGT